MQLYTSPQETLILLIMTLILRKRILIIRKATPILHNITLILQKNPYYFRNITHILRDTILILHIDALIIYQNIQNSNFEQYILSN